MKPIRLRFGGLGPYRDEVDIDFTALEELGLYLIVGETGAGKSTIFDAMTFALYGSLANDRTARLLVSDHPERVAPFVDLTFDLGPRRFRVGRTLADGTRQAKPGDQRLEELTEGGIDPITKSKEVTEKIEELIGLDADQFFKVVMIPQNQFREFLLAADKDKEALLQTLFGTHLYQRIAERLDASADEQVARVTQATADLEGHRRDARTAVDDLPELPEFEHLPDVDEQLHEVIAAVAVARTALEARSNDLNIARAAAIGAAATAEKEAARFDAAEQLEQERRAAAEDESVVTTAREAVAAHERAVSVDAPAAQFVDAGEATSTAAEAVAAAEDELRAVLGRPITTSPILSFALDTDVDGDLSGFARRVATARKSIGDADDLYADIDRLQSVIGDAQEAATTIAADLATAEEESTRLAGEVETLEAEVKSVAAAGRDFPELDRRLVALEEQLVEADVDSRVAAMDAAQKAFDDAETTSRAADEAHASAMTRQTENLAGRLAQRLVPAEPCPVCGSTEHPTPAAIGPEEEVDVDAALEDLRSADRAREAARGALDEAQKAVAAAKEVRESLPSAAEQEELRASHAAAGSALERQEALGAELEDLRTKAEECKERVRDLRAAIAQAEADRKRAEEDLAKGTASATAIIGRDDVDAATDWCADVDSAVTSLTGARTAAGKAAVALETSKASLDAALDRAGFASTDEATASRLDEQSLTAARDLVHLAEARNERITRLEGQVGSEPVPAERPDVARLEEERSAAEAEAGAAENDLAKVGSSEDRLRRAAKQIESLDAGIAEMSRIADQCVEIAKIFKSGEVRTDRLSLERWVQRSMFAEVCDVASVRLLDLSHGRYRLTLEPEGAAHAKKTRGLALFVTDSFTGRNRPVQTLSGGEQFLTSLALALALADVVQQQAGGIDLGALFIDEGFGSLDGDTLDTAVDVLRALQGTGRTIGVISHVESMQSELPIGIVVEKHASGSRVRTGSGAA